MTEAPPAKLNAPYVRKAEHGIDGSHPVVRPHACDYVRRRSASWRARRAETTFPLRSKSTAAYSLSAAAAAPRRGPATSTPPTARARYWPPPWARFSSAVAWVRRFWLPRCSSAPRSRPWRPVPAWPGPWPSWRWPGRQHPAGRCPPHAVAAFGSARADGPGLRRPRGAHDGRVCAGRATRTAAGPPGRKPARADRRRGRAAAGRRGRQPTPVPVQTSIAEIRVHPARQILPGDHR